ncbi:MAG: efflux RND transporter periplasmic adaptor subunit [Chitinophagales bacterium]
MKNIKSIVIIVVTLIIGGGIGYLISTYKQSKTNMSENQHSSKSEDEQIYTCAMHPQIRQDDPGDCPICGMELVPLTSVLSEDNPTAMQMTEQAVQLANIQTTIIGNVSNDKEVKALKLNGTIEADERQTASLTAHLPGRIEKLYVGFTGEYVSKGQRIAKIYSPELITAQRELIEAKKIQDINPALLNAAKNKLKYWKLPESTINDILEQEVVRENFDIYAEASGVVQNKRVEVGDHVMDGTVMFEVQNLYNLWVVFEAYESDLPSLNIGQKVSFTTPAVPNKTFTTTISFIDPVINKQTRIARIRGEIANQSGKLKPEMFVEGQMIGATKQSNKTEPMLIPKSAVLWTGERSVAYVKLPGTQIPSFEYREIEIGESFGSSYVVKNGLMNGEEVVTNGAFVIDASAQLNNRSSMMNKNVSLKKTIGNAQTPNFNSTTPEKFKEQLTEVTLIYLELKEALVDSDSDKAKTIANQFLNQLQTVDMTLVKNEAHLFWMEKFKALQSHGKALISSSVIEKQRDQFYFLSQTLINTLRAFGVSNDTFYVQHCPMANNDEGAEWISKDKEVKNPYFGEKMLKCGFIQDTIMN